MSLDMNRVFFGGRLTEDPTPLGDTKQGCKFDVASNRFFKTKDGVKREEVTFMPVTCWGIVADIVMAKCTKGTSVIIEGRIEVRKFVGEDGSNKKYVNIVANDVRFLSTKTPVSSEGGRAVVEEDTPDRTAEVLKRILGSK